MLIVIETSDVVFAVDSIPAILAVSREQFIVFSSNAFAILGLRALYFLLADLREKFSLLQQGLAVILAFVGVKMIIAEWYHIPTWVSLGVIAVVLAVSIWLSIRKDDRELAIAVAEGRAEPNGTGADDGTAALPTDTGDQPAQVASGAESAGAGEPGRHPEPRRAHRRLSTPVDPVGAATPSPPSASSGDRPSGRASAGPVDDHRRHPADQHELDPPRRGLPARRGDDVPAATPDRTLRRSRSTPPRRGPRLAPARPPARARPPATHRRSRDGHRSAGRRQPGLEAGQAGDHVQVLEAAGRHVDEGLGAAAGQAQRPAHRRVDLDQQGGRPTGAGGFGWTSTTCPRLRRGRRPRRRVVGVGSGAPGRRRPARGTMPDPSAAAIR